MSRLLTIIAFMAKIILTPVTPIASKKVYLEVMRYCCFVCYLLGYLSPYSLQHADLKYVSHYTLSELLEGDQQNDSVSANVRISDTSVKPVQEKTYDILLVGNDPLFVKEKGMECKLHWMLQQEKLFELVDKEDPLRCDFRSLSGFLDVELKSLRDQKSYTQAIIEKWSKRTGQSMTIGLMYTLLKHPGIVGNDAAARHIEKVLNGNGHEVSYARVGMFANVLS